MTTLREAAQQALEAMRRAVPTGKITLYEWDKALSDLADALAQQAEPYAAQSAYWAASNRMRVDPVTGNVSIGAQQAEPVTIERLRDALVASRIIPPAAVEDPEEYDDGVTLHRIEALHRRIT